MKQIIQSFKRGETILEGLTDVASIKKDIDSLFCPKIPDDRYCYFENNVPIRLTDERWYHITTVHPEMADHYYEILDTIENPVIIYKVTLKSKSR